MVFRCVGSCGGWVLLLIWWGVVEGRGRVRFSGFLVLGGGGVNEDVRNGGRMGKLFERGGLWVCNEGWVRSRGMVCWGG